MKNEMIDIFFYLGYIVGVVFLFCVLIVLCWVIFTKLLNVKHLRNLTFKIILKKEIQILTQSQYEFLLSQIAKQRRISNIEKDKQC